MNILCETCHIFMCILYFVLGAIQKKLDSEEEGEEVTAPLHKVQNPKRKQSAIDQNDIGMCITK